MKILFIIKITRNNDISAIDKKFQSRTSGDKKIFWSTLCDNVPLYFIFQLLYTFITKGNKTQFLGEIKEEYKMKATGIVRKIDDLGRVVLPIELRRTLGISERDSLEIYVDGENIVLKKYAPACIFCGSADEIVDFRDKAVCKKCIEEMKG